MQRSFRVITVSLLVAIGLTLATAAFAEKDSQAGQPWNPYDDHCAAQDVCF